MITVSDGTSSARATLSGCTPTGPALSTLTLSPTSVLGGSTSKGTATLTGAAPTGGTVVTLSSKTPTVATVPASVTVPAGATSMGFSISTVSVTASTSVTISASLGGVTKTAILTVTPSLGPAAPTPLAPANGASVLEPLTISWSAVTDPSGIIAYNWQISPSSSLTPVIMIGSTSGQTQDVVNGLAAGTYFWRVQAVSGAFVQGAWSRVSSFIVTGVGPGAPGTPTLAPTQAYSTFHPMEVIRFSWTAVAGAATYVLQASTDPSFPVLTRFQFDNIPNPAFSFAIGDSNQGNYYARVYAVDATGIAGAPSNVITFSVFFTNPLPPPPSPVSPANGVTLTLPVTPTWTAVPNPQPGGYELQIAKDSAFSTIEILAPQLNGQSYTVLSLTSGTKFWRVRSMQGDASPTTAAVTAWSTTGTFGASHPGLAHAHHQPVVQRRLHLGSGPAHGCRPSGWRRNHPDQLEPGRSTRPGDDHDAGQHRLDAVPDSGRAGRLGGVGDAHRDPQLRYRLRPVYRAAALTEVAHDFAEHNQRRRAAGGDRDVERSGSRRWSRREPHE